MGNCKKAPLAQNARTHREQPSLFKTNYPTMIMASRISVNEEEAFERACHIWYAAPEGRAAKELSELPSGERERVWADMSGNNEISEFEIPSEDPEQIQRCFQEFHRELQALPAKYPTKALALVLQQSPTYVCNPICMLKFLRAREYSVRSALELMIKHFDMKQQLFGDQTLTRDIVLSDLNESDMDFLQHGAYQYLKGTDRAGRSVSFLSFADPSYAEEHRKLNVLRTMFYLNTVASESEMVQRLGIVRVGYFHQRYPMGGPDKELIRMSLQIIETVPIRPVAFYLVSGSSVWSQTVDFMVLLASPFLRVRTRTMFGSFFENMYALLCLGIPQDSFPAREDGSLMTGNLFEWIRHRKAVESHKMQHTS